MSLLDAGIAVFTLAMGAIGWELGFVRSVLPLIGFLGGALAGSRIGATLLTAGSSSRYAPVITLLVALFAGAVMAAVMDAIGIRIQAGLGRRPIARGVDGFGGATLLALLALLVAWAFGAVVVQAVSPGGREVRRAVEGSRVLAALNGVLPPSGPLLNVLRRVDPVPTVEGPSIHVAAPDPRVLRSPAVGRAKASVVKVIGTACGLGLEGSGWSPGRGLIVTNAHVVAGGEDTKVIAAGGAELGASVVHYDPRNDVAVLRVSGLAVPPLRMRPATVGSGAAVLGYPENGPFAATAARVGRSGAVTTQDSYGRGRVRRRVTPFRGLVRSGNSGGPLVDSHGRVAATVFAANDTGAPGGLGVPDGVVRKALGGPLGPVGSGPCVA